MDFSQKNVEALEEMSFFFFFFPLKFSFMLQMYVLTAPKNKQTEKPLTGTCQYIFPLSPVKEVPPALP